MKKFPRHILSALLIPLIHTNCAKPMLPPHQSSYRSQSTPTQNSEEMQVREKKALFSNRVYARNFVAYNPLAGRELEQRHSLRFDSDGESVTKSGWGFCLPAERGTWQFKDGGIEISLPPGGFHERQEYREFFKLSEDMNTLTSEVGEVLTLIQD